MSPDELKAHARRLAEEVLTQGDLSIARELFRADCRHHAPEAIAPGGEGIVSWVTELRGAFPDLCAIVEDEIADREHVVLRLTLSGTHEGEFRGLPPTRRRATWGHVEILRVDADGRFADRWSCWDQHVLLRQLGCGTDHQADWS